MLYIENFLIRFTGAAVCFTAAVLFAAALTRGVKNIGNIFGLAVVSVLFIYFAFNKPVSVLLQKTWNYKAGKAVISFTVIFFCLGFLSAFIMSVFMVKECLNKPDKPYPAIVLGCKVNGTYPSVMLGRRIDAAYDYLSENESAVAVVSGGQGQGEGISEAQCMKERLVERGISAERIFTEDKSSDTFENIDFSKKILEEQNLGTDAVIITDGFHQFRASLIAHKAGLKTTAFSAHTPEYLVLTYWVREWFGIIEQILLK